MKHLITTAFVCLFLSGLSAQSGLKFHPGDWAEVLRLAKTQNKLIFVDAYTTWCGPCKMMVRNVYPEKAVGDFFNEQFINVKIDMEQGEGARLAKHYSIDIYPSLLFINGDGKVVHQGVGFHNAPELLQLGRIAADPSRRLSSFEDNYAAGERSPEFLHDYAIVSYRAMSSSQTKIALEYLDTQSDWSTEKNLRFIFTFVGDIDSKLFNYLILYRQDFEEAFGAPIVMDRIQDLIITEAFSDEPTANIVKKVERVYAIAYPESADRLFILFKMNYYQYTGAVEDYIQTTIHYFDHFPSNNAEELNTAAWNFCELSDELSQLEKALEWAERSVALDSNYYHYDTLASLYYRLGKKKKARKAAENAIALARSSGDDSTPTKQLLEKINAM